MYDATMAVFDELGIQVNPKTIMSTMPVSQRQMVEIAKAVSYNSKIIVFDEPTSSLTENEVEHLFKIINMLRSRGCGIIYISHKMEGNSADFRRHHHHAWTGQWIATKPAKELTMDEIIRLMVGPGTYQPVSSQGQCGGRGAAPGRGPVGYVFPPAGCVPSPPERARILGIAGLDASGRTELLENIFGVATRKSGKNLPGRQAGVEPQRHRVH